MQEVKVSVIIPTYKRPQDLCRAIDSVLHQTIDSFEVIVVDDNGVDSEEGKATALVMEKYKDVDVVRYIRHNVNKNGSAARNTGIKASKGKYIAFLDDDDVFSPERLDKMFEYMELLDDSYGACYSGYTKKNGAMTQLSEEKVSGYIFKQVLMRSFYLGSGSNMFFRRKVIDDIGLFDESFSRNQDLEYLVRVTRKYKMAFIDLVLLDVILDVRTTKPTFKSAKERERLFRNRFSGFLDDFNKIEQKEIKAMYKIDWIRTCIIYKRFIRAFFNILFSGIPIRVFLSYSKYVKDRMKRNVSYGFVVNYSKKRIE